MNIGTMYLETSTRLRIPSALVAATVLLPFFLASQALAQPRDFDPVLAARLQSELDRQRERYGIIGASAAIISPRHGRWTGVSGMSDSVAGTV